jgi:RNA-splicing ligase RtcB
MLIASKSGCISASKLVSETDKAWTLEVENSLHRLSKTDSRQRAFSAMSDALEWAGAEQEMIDHFVALEAEELAVSNQVPG